MTVPSAPATSGVDPFSDDFLRDPFPHHETLRELGPIVRLERYGIWAAARYDEVFRVLMDAETFVSGAGVGITNFHTEPPPRPPSIILEADAPLHTRTHRILARALSPAALRSMRATFEREAEALVDRLLERDTVDGARDVAHAFPFKVFPDAVGLPEAGREALEPYGDIVFNFFGPRNARFDAAMAAAPAISKAIAAICERDVVTPDGLAANVFAAHDAGECTYAEASMLIRSLLSAGLDTTVSTLACAIVCLARNPEQWDAVRANPALARAAFDEALRFESPAQTFFRTAARAATFGDTVVEPGAKVLLFLASANRDPRKWERPNDYDVTRKTGPHVGMGVGVHRCVGEMLAKLEGEILFAALARRVARFELVAEPTMRINNTMRSYSAIPLRLHAA